MYGSRQAKGRRLLRAVSLPRQITLQIAMAPRPLLTLSMLALCGVCRAYQAATGRTGTPASQVTMMAKSKVRRGPAAAAASAELPRGALL